MVSDDIPATIVTYAKIQNMTTARLLGRTTAGAGVVEEISVGAGLTLSGGVLDTAGGAGVTGSGAGHVYSPAGRTTRSGIRRCIFLGQDHFGDLDPG